MPKREIKSVIFRGEERELHSLIGAASVMRGIAWSVKAADFVGGSYNVTFMRREGAISKAEAQGWIDAALRLAKD